MIKVVHSKSIPMKKEDQVDMIGYLCRHKRSNSQSLGEKNKSMGEKFEQPLQDAHVSMTGNLCRLVGIVL